MLESPKANVWKGPQTGHYSGHANLGCAQSAPVGRSGPNDWTVRVAVLALMKVLRDIPTAGLGMSRCRVCRGPKAWTGPVTRTIGVLHLRKKLSSETARRILSQLGGAR